MNATSSTVDRIKQLITTTKSVEVCMPSVCYQYNLYKYNACKHLQPYIIHCQGVVCYEGDT